MGKTLTSILTIGAAIAVNVIPFFGQVASAAIASLITGITVAGISAAISLGSKLLGLGPSSPKPETTETAIKTSRPPRVSAYGRSRLYGAYMLYETAENGTAVDVYAVHEGQLDGIEARYLGDDQVTLTGDTVNEGDDGRYKGSAVKFYTTDGSVPGAGFPAIETLIPTWEGRGDGVVALALTAKAVKAKEFQETYPQSSVPMPSMVARWQLCPDPSSEDPLDESGWTWTENPVRHLLHYKLVREGPRPALARSNAGYDAALATLREAWWARKIAPTLQMWIDASDHCDSARALAAGGSEALYRSCLAHKHTDKHQDVIGGLLATFDGWMAPRADGAFAIYPGQFYEPTVSIGPAEIVAYTWQAGVDDGQAVNEIICSYVSAEHDYNTVECDPWRDETDITARGQVLSAPLEVQVPSHAQARYLARRHMARTNAHNRGTVTTNIAGRAARGERYINLALEEAGTVFFSGPVEITKLTRNLAGGVSFEWVEVDPNIDTWNPATQEGEPAPVGTRIAPEALDAPTIDSVTVLDGPRLEIVITAPDRADLTWFARVREDGGIWNTDLEYSDADPGASVTIITDIVPYGDLEVQVAYMIGDGRLSPYSVIEEVVVDDDIILDGGEP